MNRARLEKLAAHLETGQLGHAVFDFSVLNRDGTLGEGNDAPSRCGTNGCAIGELPIVFPDDWVFSKSGVPALSDGSASACRIWENVEGYFEISGGQSDLLFLSGSPPLLPRTATRNHVAARIRELLARAV